MLFNISKLRRWTNPAKICAAPPNYAIRLTSRLKSSPPPSWGGNLNLAPIQRTWLAISNSTVFGSEILETGEQYHHVAAWKAVDSWTYIFININQEVGFLLLEEYSHCPFFPLQLSSLIVQLFLFIGSTSDLSIGLTIDASSLFWGGLNDENRFLGLHSIGECPEQRADQLRLFPTTLDPNGSEDRFCFKSST